MYIANKKENAVTKRDEALAKIDDYFNSGHFEKELARRIAYKTESTLTGCETALVSYLEDETLTARFILTNVRMQGHF